MADTHTVFIAAAYGVSALCIAALVLRVVLDGRAVRRRLDAMEARGVRRRSARRETAPTGTALTGNGDD